MKLCLFRNFNWIRSQPGVALAELRFERYIGRQILPCKLVFFTITVKILKDFKKIFEDYTGEDLKAVQMAFEYSKSLNIFSRCLLNGVS